MRRVIYPPAECSPAYFWIINDKIDRDECRWQLDDMADKGLRSVCFHPEPPEFRPILMETRLDLPYLSKEYFDFVREMVLHCKKIGMHYWLYDEGGWPSGNACGQVMAVDPNCFRQQAIARGEDGKAYIKTLPEKLPDGRYAYPNLLTPGVAETFIALTHQRHLEAVPKEIGKTIKYVFQDEACFCKHAWTWDFAEVFKERKGYDIMPFLDVLIADPTDDAPEEHRRARIDYQDVRSQLFAERFVYPIRSWCREHKLISGGHFGGEDDPRNNVLHGYGHIMRVLRGLDMPGVDVIWRQLFPGGRSHIFPKYASSIARQSKLDLSLSETGAVFGNGLTQEQFKWLVDYQAVRGINTFVLSCYEMSTRDHLLYVNPRPHCGPGDPQWDYSKSLHQYITWLCYFLRQGRACAKTMFFYDIRSIWGGASRGERAAQVHENASQELMRRQVDFDFVDDDALCDANYSKNRGVKVGSMTYDTLILPREHDMDPRALAKVEEFKKAGLRVLDETQLDQVEPLVTLDPPCPDIRVTKRQGKDYDLFFIVNETDTPKKLKINFKSKYSKLSEIDLCYGDQFNLTTYRKGDSVEYTFGRHSSAMFLLEKDLFPFATHVTKLLDDEYTPARILNEGWTLQAIQRNWVRDRFLETEDFSENSPVIPVELGDWSQYLGKEFSGKAVYRCEFELDKAGVYMMDLGEVKYSCLITVNGEDLATSTWHPYRIICELKKGKNEIKIIVINTLANAILAEDTLPTWKKLYPKQRDYYDAMERKFEAESLPSGLFGPVTLKKSPYLPQ